MWGSRLLNERSPIRSSLRAASVRHNSNEKSRSLQFVSYKTLLWGVFAVTLKPESSPAVSAVTNLCQMSAILTLVGRHSSWLVAQVLSTYPLIEHTFDVSMSWVIPNERTTKDIRPHSKALDMVFRDTFRALLIDIHWAHPLVNWRLLIVGCYVGCCV